MTAIRWTASTVLFLFAIVIVSGWSHGHYPFAFVAIIGVSLLAAWVRGYTDADR